MHIEGLILAAGKSTRFNFKNKHYKKYFLPLNNVSLLTYIISAMHDAGINRIHVVASRILNKKRFKKRLFKQVKKLLPNISELTIEIIDNPRPERENGYSLFLGLNHVKVDHVLLSMADHVFSKNVYRKLIKKYNGYEVLLATDPMETPGYYDLEDATKVNGMYSYIMNMGKELLDYNRLDMGAFILKTKPLKRICNQVESRKYRFGVTDVILSALRSNLKVGYLDFPDIIWIDVDDYSNYYRLINTFNNSPNLTPFEITL
ncbi:MAG: NTP transferase domain-containing protein [Promethearchaeota archaeon]